METEVKKILKIQNVAWRHGHDNYGATIDVYAAAFKYLKYFKHLNPAQKRLFDKLEQMPELNHAKKLCSRAQKSVRHFIITLK